MTAWVHRVLIVAAPYAPLARSLAASIGAGESGKGMFQTPLSPTGTGTPTHYISAGLIWPEFAAMLQDPQSIVTASQGAVTLAQVQAMLAASTIRADADPHAVLAEVGLKIISEGA